MWSQLAFYIELAKVEVLIGVKFCKASRPSAWEAVQAPVRLRPLLSARLYFMGSGDDSVVPQTSGIVPLCPSVWLQFGYSARRLPALRVGDSASLDVASRPIPGKYERRPKGKTRTQAEVADAMSDRPSLSECPELQKSERREKAAGRRRLGNQRPLAT